MPPVVGNSLSVEMRAQVARALVTCRQGRQALSLVLVEIDHFASLARTLGPVVAEKRVADLGEICGSCDLPGASLLQARQACFALVLPDCDRGEAVAVADEILPAPVSSQFRVRRPRARALGERWRGHGPTSAQEFSRRRPHR